MLLDALLLNAAILIAAVLALWAVSVRINDVSFIDSFWGAGMGLLAVVSWLQLGPGAGPLATLIMAMTAAWGFPWASICCAAGGARARTSAMSAS